VGVDVGVGVGVGVGVSVPAAVAVGVGVNVAVAVGVGVGVNVAVAVGVAVGLAVGLGAGVGRGLGAPERLPSAIKPHAPAAKHAIAISRLILRKKRLVVMLGELVSPDATRRKKTRPFIALLRKQQSQVPEKEDFFRLPVLQKLSGRFESV